MFKVVGSGKAKVDGAGNIKLGKNVAKSTVPRVSTTVLGSESLDNVPNIGAIQTLLRQAGTFNQADQLWEPFQGNTIADAKNTIPAAGYDWTEYSPDGDAPALVLNTSLAGDNTNFIQVTGNTDLERQGVQLAANKMTANGGLVSGEYYFIQFIIRINYSVTLARKNFCMSFGGQVYPLIDDIGYNTNVAAQVDDLPAINVLVTRIVNCRDASQPFIVYQRQDTNGDEPWKIGPIIVSRFQDLTGEPTGSHSGTNARFSYVTDIYGNSAITRKLVPETTIAETARYDFNKVKGENYNENETMNFEDPGSTSHLQYYKITHIFETYVPADGSSYLWNHFEGSFLLGSDSFKGMYGARGHVGIGDNQLGGLNNLPVEAALTGYSNSVTIGRYAGANWSSNYFSVWYGANSVASLDGTTYTEPDTGSTVKIAWTNLYVGSGDFPKTTAIGSEAMKNVFPVDQGSPVSPDIQDLHSTDETNSSTNSLIGSRRDCGYNTAVGAQALYGGRDTLNASTAVGYRALGGNKGAYYRNVGLGNESWYVSNGGPLDSTSVGSIAIGYKAARYCRDAKGFVAIGYFALDGGHSAHYATAIGERALEACWTGVNNTAIGNRSSAKLTTGNDNVTIGYRSGNSLQTGSKNTFIGTEVCSHGIDNTAALLTGDNNTAIGYKAGVNLKSGASYNTVIGGQAQGDNLTGDYNILIGSDVKLDQGNGSNQINIGMDNAIGVQILCKRILLTYSHDTPNTCISHTGLKIPAHSIIKSVTAKVYSVNGTLATYKVNIFLATNSSLARDTAPTTTGITNPEILGAGATNTYQQNSTIAMAGTASDIDMGSGATLKTVYYNEPRDTIVGSADVYVVVCNAVDNGTGDEDSCRVELAIEYIGKD